MSSAAEAELGALFINPKTAVSMHQTLTELGHPQPTTTHTNANRQCNGTCATHQQDITKSTKAMDMRFHWLRCRNAQGQFC
jgi:hypothetical protein